MTKYRRVVVSQHGGPNVLRLVEDILPELQPGDVRVRILEVPNGLDPAEVAW